MTVLVTGCAGFIGSHLTEELLARGLNVVGIDNFDPYYSVRIKKRNMAELKKHKKFRFVQGSILNDSALKKIKNVETVYHEAAIAGVRNSIKEPARYCENNSLGTLKLLNHFRDVKKFVYASSSSVYGSVDARELPMRETMTANPISPYGMSKLQGEEWCRLFTKVYGTPTTSLRYFTVYGPRQRPDEAFTRFISKALKGRPIEIYGSGNQTRDFTYVKDIVDGTILAAEKGRGVLNLGSGSRITVKEMVEHVSWISNKKIKVKHINKQPGDAPHTWADINKARAELGYEPKHSLEEGIGEQVEWCRKNLSLL